MPADGYRRGQGGAMKGLFKEEDSVFGNRWFLTSLVNSFIDDIPPEKQVDRIIKFLEDERVWSYCDKTNDTILLDLLERAVGGNGERYRKHLIAICNLIEAKINKFSDVFIYTPRFRTAMLARIIKGWFPGNYEKDSHSMECFKTLCKFSGTVQVLPGDFKGFLHEHLRESKYSGLDIWICNKEIPDVMAHELLKIRARLAGPSQGKKELEFLRRSRFLKK